MKSKGINNSHRSKASTGAIRSTAGGPKPRADLRECEAREADGATAPEL
jgi:hypothetical protein